MGIELGDLFNMIGQQNNLSGLQQWAAEGGIANDPNGTRLAQLAPRSYEQMAPTFIQQQQQGQALQSFYGGGNQPQQASQPQTNPYASVGDTNPNAPVPQVLPDPNQPSSLAQMAPAQTGPSQQALAKLQSLQYLPKAMQDQLYGQMSMNGGQIPGIDMGNGQSSQSNVADTLANAIANYKQPPMTGTASKTPLGMLVQSKVYDINPIYDANQYKTIAKTDLDFSPGGSVGQKITQVQTAINHLGSMADASQALGGANAGVASQPLNAAYNWWEGQTKPVTDYNRYSGMAGDEVANFVAGSSGGTDQARKTQHDLLNINQSPDARMNAAQAAVGTMFGKLEPVVDQYNQAKGTNKTVWDFLDNGTKQSLSKIGMTPPDNGGNAPQSPNLSSISSNQPMNATAMQASPMQASPQIAPAQSGSFLSSLGSMLDSGGDAMQPQLQAQQYQVYVPAPVNDGDGGHQAWAQKILDARKAATGKRGKS